MRSMKSGSRQLDFLAATYHREGAKPLFREISAILRWRRRHDGLADPLSQAHAMFKRVVSRAKEMYELPNLVG
jgi:hypothetical protein